MGLFATDQVIFENGKFTDWDGVVLGRVRTPAVRLGWPFSRKKKQPVEAPSGTRVIGPDDAPLFWTTPLKVDGTKSIPDLWVDDQAGLRLVTLSRRRATVAGLTLPSSSMGDTFDAEDGAGRPLGSVTASSLGRNYTITDSAGAETAMVSLTADDTWHIELTQSTSIPHRSLAFAFVIAAEEVYSRHIPV